MAQAMETSEGQPGSQYINHHAVRDSWKKVYVMLMVPRKPETSNSNLAALMNTTSATGQTIYLIVDNNGDTKLSVLRDVDIKTQFRVFVHVLYPPWNLADFNFNKWRARILIPYLVTSASKLKWNNWTIQLLFQLTSISAVHSTITSFWNEVRTDIMKDLEEIMENPSNLLCNMCTESCSFKQHPFHFDVSKFQEVSFFEDLSSTGIFTRLRLFGSGRPNASPILLKLKEKYDSTTQYSRDNVQEIVDIIDSHGTTTNEEFCCYTLLICQGKALEEDRDWTNVEMMQDNRIIKIVYVGCTKGNTFRRNHLNHKQSTVHQILSRKARLFVIRNFVSNSKIAAKKNESFVINLMKSLIRKAVDDQSKLDFILLNQKSEPMQLLGTRPSEVNEIQAFINSNTKLVRVDSPNDATTRDPAFTGNYNLNEEVPLARFEDRNFLDVEPQIKIIEKRSKSAQWFDIQRLI